MTIKSINELLAQADATLPDNTLGEISAADVRTIIKDFLDTMSPGYGALRLATQTLTLAPTPPVVIAPMTQSVAATAGLFTNNLTNGSTTRTLNGVTGSTVQLIATGDIAGGNGNEVTITLYKNGTPTLFKQTVTTSGAANRIGFNIIGFDYTMVDATYDLRAAAPAGSFTFNDVAILAQSQPVRSFV
jgi:hypothetical protein